LFAQSFQSVLPASCILTTSSSVYHFSFNFATHAPDNLTGFTCVVVVGVVEVGVGVGAGVGAGVGVGVGVGAGVGIGVGVVDVVDIVVAFATVGAGVGADIFACQILAMSLFASTLPQVTQAFCICVTSASEYPLAFNLATQSADSFVGVIVVVAIKNRKHIYASYSK